MAEEVIYDLSTGSMSGGRMPQIEDVDDNKPEEGLVEEKTNLFEYEVPDYNSQNQPEEDEPEDEANDKDEQNQKGNEPEEEDEEDDSETKDDALKDHSEAALYAEHLKEVGFFANDYELEKDLSHEALAQKMISHSQELATENVLSEIASKYGGEEVLNAAQFLMNGGDPVFLNEGSALKKYSSMDLDIEANQEQVILFAYQKQGIDPDNAKLFVETFKERGELDIQAVKAAKNIDSYLANYNKTLATAPQGADPAVEEDRINNIKKVVNKKAIGPYKLSDREATDLIDFTTNPRYITKVKVGNGYQNKYVTGLDRAVAALSQDIEKQILMAKVLLDDFDFKSIKAEAKEEAATGALDRLNRNRSTGNRNRPRSKNAFYRD
jgi:hypothetical protein